MTPSTAWKETIKPGEEKRIQKYAEIFHAIQIKRDTPGSLKRAYQNQMTLKSSTN